MLRSGHLAHHDAEHEALEIDLTAERVRTALTLLDGVAQGQPLAALLGYRFERAVRDRGVTLAQYILPIRRLAPLRPDGAAPASPTPSDQVAARDVVDGVALLERWRNEGPALFDALQQLVKFPPPPAEVFVMPPQEQRNQLAVELDRLADSYDAVADLLLAETVHQNVLGNHERAAAALGALDRQGRPPRVEFVRTPRTGKSYSQRLLVLIGDDSVPAVVARAGTRPAGLRPSLGSTPGWPGSSVTRGGSGSLPRSPVSPHLSFSGSRSSGCRRSRRCWPSQAPGRDEPSELEERLRQAFLAARPPSSAARRRPCWTEPPPGDPRFVGLGAFRALTRLGAHPRHHAPPGRGRRPRPAAGRGRRPVRRGRARPAC